MRGLWGPMKVFMSYWELIWKRVRGTAWLSQLSFPEKKAWIPWASQEKQAGLYQGKYKSLGPDVATGGCCQKWATLTDTQQSPVIPETCGSCKNNPQPPMNPCHYPVTLPREGCVFSWGCPPWVWCMHEWGCVCLSVCTCKTGDVHYFGVKALTTTE